MTLDDCKKFRYENFFLAIIKREMNWGDAENVFLTIPDYPFPMTALDLLKMAVEDAIAEKNEPLTEENKKRIEEEVKQSITPQLEEWYPIILVKHAEGYIDLSEMKELESVYKIVCQIPFSQYYKECDYSFKEDEDGPYLNIDMEQFELFVKDYEEGKFDD